MSIENVGNCNVCHTPIEEKIGGVRKCVRHHRFYQMRHACKHRNKSIPTMEQLESLFTKLVDMKCPHCSRVMNWLHKDGGSTVITIQHYRSGEFGFLCMMCNAQHAPLPGDSFMEIPVGMKRCPKCEAVKPDDQFYDQSRYGGRGKNPYCKPCEREKHRAYRAAHPDRPHSERRRRVKLQGA